MLPSEAVCYGPVASYLVEHFEDNERALLARHFSTVDGQVFSLVNLDEEVKAALFARYSRSAKSLRRVFLDEFCDGTTGASEVERSLHATELINRVVGEYGDDSVAQLGVVHLGIEQVSTSLTRLIERGRLMAYLEKSTRYVPVSQPRTDGSDRVVVPAELAGVLRDEYISVSHDLLELYEKVRRLALADLEASLLADPGPPERRALRAAALDVARTILPTGTMTNVGIVANAQSLEYLITRLRTYGDLETIQVAQLLSEEARRQFPALTSRLDRQDRGGATTAYLLNARAATRDLVVCGSRHEVGTSLEESEVRLVDFDVDGDERVLSWIAFESGVGSVEWARDWVRGLDDSARAAVFSSYVGERTNRRLRPGRAFEMVRYTFEVVCDFASLRDLGRHRLLTVMVQDFGPDEGFAREAMWEKLGVEGEIYDTFVRADGLYRKMEQTYGCEVARLILPLASRVRSVFSVNARELMHLCELRSQPQGHPGYRRIAIDMFGLVAQLPQHHLITSSFSHVDMATYEAGRMASERRVPLGE